MRIELNPMNPEKTALLEAYLAEWRTVYSVAGKAARALETPRWFARTAHRFYKSHSRFCEHEPACAGVPDYFKQAKREQLAYIKRRLRNRADDRINYLAFSQAWFKGYANRYCLPTAYRQMAMVPKNLARAWEGRLSLRLFPGLELVFEVPDSAAALETASGAKALYLLQRKNRWLLRV